jgi:hypothetical protein
LARYPVLFAHPVFLGESRHSSPNGRVASDTGVLIRLGEKLIGVDLTIQDKRGRTRLALDEDLVRAEVAAALYQNVPVIPVLVQGAEMPTSEDLPENLRPLARRNGIDLSGAAWRASVERLIKELDRVMKPFGSL